MCIVAKHHYRKFEHKSRSEKWKMNRDIKNTKYLKNYLKMFSNISKHIYKSCFLNKEILFYMLFIYLQISCYHYVKHN